MAWPRRSRVTSTIEAEGSQHRRVLLLVALTTLPLLLLAATSAWQGAADVEFRTAEERVGLAQVLASTTDAFVEASISLLESLALTRDVVAPGSPAELGALLGRIDELSPALDGVALFDQYGDSMASGGALNIADREYFRQALVTGKPVVTDAFIGRVRQIPAVTVAVPVNFANGLRGVLVGVLSTTELQRELQAQAGDLFVLVIDSQGRVFVDRRPGLAESLVSLRGRADAEAALTGQSGSQRLIGLSGEQVLAAYAPVARTGWGVLVVQPASAAFGPVRRQLGESLGLFALAAALTLLLGWHLASRLTRINRREMEARARAEAAATALRAISRESESRRRFLEGLIASAPVAIAVLEGPQHRYLTINAAYQKLKPGAQMVGRSLAEVFPEFGPQGRIEVLDRVYATGEQFTAIDQLVRIADSHRNLEDRYFALVLSRYDDAEGLPGGLLVIATETTDVVLARQRAEREKDEFLATASHELKTPISSIGLSAQMIERIRNSDRPDPERLKRLADVIQSQVERTSDLITDLLEVSRLEPGVRRLRSQRVDLVKLARAAVRREQDILPEESRHRLAVRQNGRSKVVVQGDEARLDQVLSNLLSNAVKYSPQGGQIVVKLEQSDGSVRLSVSDQGVGIPEAERESLFAPFSRTESARVSGVQGTGLGLYITRRIVEAHGGSVEIGDTTGGGTTVRVELPAE